MTLKTVTLAQAMEWAGTAVRMDEKKADLQFGQGLFRLAVEHHARLGLTANIAKGTTRNRDGWLSGFIDWSEADAAIYEDAPHFAYFDFFRGSILNSCSRMANGMGA